MKHIVTLLLALSLLLGACALADDRADMLVAAAVNELGYSATKGGYSKYGEWGGSAYGEWCSEFVSWCVNFADEYYGASMLGNDYPLQTSCEGGAMWYKERGRYVTVNGGLRGEDDAAVIELHRDKHDQAAEQTQRLVEPEIHVPHPFFPRERGL